MTVDVTAGFEEYAFQPCLDATDDPRKFALVWKL